MSLKALIERVTHRRGRDTTRASRARREPQAEALRRRYDAGQTDSTMGIAYTPGGFGG